MRARHTPSLALDLVARGRKRPRPMPTRRYTEEQFRTALEDPAVRTMADLCRALGIVPRGANYETARAYAKRLGLQVPVSNNQRHAFIRRIDDDAMCVEVVAASESIAEVLRRLEGPITSASYKRVNRRISELDLDTSHFRGQGYSLGRSYPERWKSIEHLLGTNTNSTKLRLCLLRSGIRAHRCERCDLSEWNGQPIPLELDHIDGDRAHNELANLRLLCPNCHALTPTYRGRNIGAYSAQATDHARITTQAPHPWPQGTDRTYP